MEIKKISENKKAYLDLLLLGDEQESMIDQYLDRGELYVLLDPDVKTVCVVTEEGDGIYEIKNLATAPSCQKQGYGKKMLQQIETIYQPQAHTLLVGTGDSPLTVPFYKKMGFTESHRLQNFFLLHYDHPIIEAGKQLVDMVYLKKVLT
ncbi:MAG: GNAT family N-acetyltransferase [Clostridiales bacterium]|nr:GNAT family N-acetyltransferase [Clostridiales bacterium]